MSVSELSGANVFVVVGVKEMRNSFNMDKNRIIRGVTTMFCLVSLGMAAPITKGHETQAAYMQPAPNLLIIVADIQRHINDDVYRFPYATDITGQNVFRASLVRLANYEALFPEKLNDVVSLAKAQCFEKLCAFEEAGANYKKAQESKDVSIRKVAGEGFERTRKFALVVNQSIDASALRTYQSDMEKKIRDLDALATEMKSTPYASLALVERERAQMQLAEFYITMRFMQPYSTNDALVEIKRNIDQNSDSKLLYTHHLMLADLHYDLAREYTILHDPEGVQFSLSQFEGFAKAARAEYHIVQKADGYPEKLEARAKLAALEAFVERVVERSR